MSTPWRSSSSSAQARRRASGVAGRGAEHGLGQRPAALERRRAPGAAAEAPGGGAPGPRRGGRLPGASRAQRRERVVGDLARPGEVPQRLAQLVRAGVRLLHQQVGEEAGAARQALAQALVELAVRVLARPGRRAEQGRVLTEVQRDAPRPPAERAAADPDHLAAGAELVQPVRRVRAEPARQHVLLPHLAARAAGPGAAPARRADGRRPRRPAENRSTPCHAGAKRASVSWPTGSISLRSTASDARRRRRSTSGSHHSRRVPERAQLALDELAGPLELRERRAGVHRRSAPAPRRPRRGRACGRSAAPAAASRPARPRGTRRAGRRAARRRGRRGTARRPRRRTSAPRRRCGRARRGARPRAAPATRPPRAAAPRARRPPPPSGRRRAAGRRAARRRPGRAGARSGAAGRPPPARARPGR